MLLGKLWNSHSWKKVRVADSKFFSPLSSDLWKVDIPYHNVCAINLYSPGRWQISYYLFSCCTLGTRGIHTRECVGSFPYGRINSYQSESEWKMNGRRTSQLSLDSILTVARGWVCVFVEPRSLKAPLSNPHIKREWIWGRAGMLLAGEIRRTRRKTCPSAILSTTNRS